MKKLLLLPGLGDVHWVFLKLQSWLEKQGPEWTAEPPEVSIWNIDNRPRTLEYLPTVPWVRVGGYFDLPYTEEKRRFDDLYTRAGSKDVIRDFHGFDAFIGTNGNMRNGVQYDRVLEDAAINYKYGPVLSHDNYGEHQANLGPYFVLGFSGFGMFAREWCKNMPADRIRLLVARLRDHFPDHRFLFTGCSWDDEFSKECVGPEDHYLVGKTSAAQFLSLVKHASGYLGWCGGNAILAQHLGTPTVAWWSKRYFPKHDRRGWETPGSRHRVLEVEDFGKFGLSGTGLNRGQEAVALAVAAFLKGGRP